MARPHAQRLLVGLTLLGGALTLAAPLAGCRGDRTDARPRRIFPDMDLQPKWKPQTETEFFALQDGTFRTQRIPDPNAVAFGCRSFDPATYGAEPWAAGYMTERASFLAEDDAFYRGTDGTPDGFLDVMPLEVTPELLELGRDKFNINCAACHGYLGDGDSMVAKAGMTPIPSNLLDEKYIDRAQRTAKDGYMFDVIRNGLWNEVTGANRMPAYAHNISAEETWAVIAYLRALQASQTMAVDSPAIPETARAELLRRRPEPEPAPEPGTPAEDGGEP